MPNRYAQPIAAQYMNTYVPIPFQEMMQAGQMKQEKYDRTASAIEQTLSKLESLQGIEGPDSERLSQIVSEAKNITDAYSNKDLSDPFVVRDLNSTIRSKINKSELNNILANKEAADKAEAAIQQLKMQNLWNPALDDRPKNFSSSGGAKWDWMPSAYMDKQKMFAPYFEKAREDYSDIVDDPSGYAVLKHGVSQDRIKSIAAENAAMMTQTPQGMAYVEQYRKLTGDMEKPAKDILYEEMLSVGRPYSSTQKQVLGASLQKLNGMGANGFGGEKTSYTVPTSSVDEIEGNNDRQKLLTISSTVQEANRILTDVNATPEQKVQAQGIVDRDKKILDMVTARVKKENGSDVNVIRQQAISKLKSLDVYKGASDEQLNELVDTYLNVGINSSLARFAGHANTLTDNIAKLTASAFDLIPRATIASLKLNPVSFYNSIEKAVGDLDKTRPFTFGDIFRVMGGTLKHTWGEEPIDISGKVEKEAQNHDVNILHNLADDIDSTEKDLQKNINKQYLAEYQHINQINSFLPSNTVSKSGTDYIVGPDGEPTEPSNLHRFIRALPNIVDQIEIKQRKPDGDYKVVGKKGKKDLIGEFVTWDVDNTLTNTGIDNNGNIVVKFGLNSNKPEGNTSGLKTHGEYEVRIPANSSMARGFVEDRINAGEYEAATAIVMAPEIMKLRANINNKDGHTINLPGDNKFTVEPNPNGSDYFVKLNGEYKTGTDPNTGESTNIGFTQKQVEDYLLSVRTSVDRFLRNQGK